MSRVGWLVPVLACGGTSAPPPDAPAAGTLDGTFGDGGTVVIPTTGTATDVAIDADGRILVSGQGGGHLVIVRLAGDGSVEATMQTGVAAPLGVPDGGAGRTGSGGLVLPMFDRLTACDADGTLTGSATFAPNNEAWHAAIAATDIYVCGTFDAGSPQPLVERVDLATGVDATTRYVGPMDAGTIFDCDLDASGDIAFVGRRSSEAIFGRVDAAANSALGSDGVAVLRDAADARAIRAVGSSYVVSGVVDGDFGVLRVGPDGTLDPTFGTAGAVTTPIGADPGNAFAIAVAGDGRIVAAGTTTSPVDQSATSSAVVRYDASGALDTSFGDGGIVQLGLGTRVFAMALAGDKLVVAGDVADPVDPTNRAFFVARLLP